MLLEHINTTPEFVQGWLKISERLGIPPDTLRRWRNRYGFPVFRAPSGKIMISMSQVVAWCNAQAEMQQRLGLDRIKGHVQYRIKFEELRQHGIVDALKSAGAGQPGTNDAEIQGGGAGNQGIGESKML